MSGAITLAMVNAEKAEAYLIAYDAKFQKANAVDGAANDYLAKYTYTPPINPGVHLVRLPIPLSAPELKLFKGRRHFRRNSRLTRAGPPRGRGGRPACGEAAAPRPEG